MNHIDYSDYLDEQCQNEDVEDEPYPRGGPYRDPYADEHTDIWSAPMKGWDTPPPTETSTRVVHKTGTNDYQLWETPFRDWLKDWDKDWDKDY